MTQGIVKFLSANRQRVAVAVDDGFTVFDIEDGEANLSDQLSGALDDHGTQTVTNLSTRQTLCVYIEAIGASQAHAISLCRQRT